MWNFALNLGKQPLRPWTCFEKLTDLRRWDALSVLSGTDDFKADDRPSKTTSDLEGLPPALLKKMFWEFENLSMKIDGDQLTTSQTSLACLMAQPKQFWLRNWTWGELRPNLFHACWLRSRRNIASRFAENLSERRGGLFSDVEDHHWWWVLGLRLWPWNQATIVSMEKSVSTTTEGKTEPQLNQEHAHHLFWHSRHYPPRISSRLKTSQ